MFWCLQRLLLFFDGWLVHPSLLHHPLPAPLSTAPIIGIFVASHRAILYLICAILFSISLLFLLQWWSFLPPPLLTLAPHHDPLIL